ncbi:MAG TPA: redoxin domain-containing protein, partial [Pyrinomonadaceae bacterium]|nr:redoxin domain-containing protein [Pyrinomonadaceae bacterium]
ELLQLAENLSKSQQNDADDTHSMIANGLTERKMFREAEKFVKIGFEKVKKEIEQQRTTTTDGQQLAKDLAEKNAVLHNGLGWIYFKENRLDEAEKEFTQAIKLNREITYFYKNLAQVYEAKNELDKAENAYINAYSTFWGKENPNVESLKSLYRKRHKNLEGFESYFETVKVTERAMRKERILSAKIVGAKSVAPFNLKNLEAQPLAFADLKNKVVVVNIWGTWCAPCVTEMPEFQELHKKYLNEKDVAILTINNDADLATIKKFMINKKYDFAVLRDENYLQTVNINVFPTTWFIDREGKISYIKIGATEKLLEEFSWRIEDLRNQNGGK